MGFNSGFKGLNIQNYNFACCLRGCETWSLTLREERRLGVFQNRVLWQIFGRKRDEVTGHWRRLHNEELSDMCCSPNIIWVMEIRKNEMGGACGSYGGAGGVHIRFRWRELRERDHLEDLGVDRRIILISRRNEDRGVEWIYPAQKTEIWQALVNAVINLRVPYNAEDFLVRWGSFSRLTLHHVVSYWLPRKFAECQSKYTDW